MRFLNYFVIESEFKKLLKFIENTGLLAIPQVISTNEYEARNIEALPPTQFKLNNDHDMFYLIPQEIPLKEVVYEPMQYKPSFSYLVITESPVIAITPCFRDGNRLYNGDMLCMISENKNYSDSVYNAFDKIINYIINWEKATSKNIGPETYKLTQKGKLEIREIHEFWLYQIDYLKAFKKRNAIYYNKKA